MAQPSRSRLRPGLDLPRTGGLLAAILPLVQVSLYIKRDFFDL